MNTSICKPAHLFAGALFAAVVACVLCLAPGVTGQAYAADADTGISAGTAPAQVSPALCASSKNLKKAGMKFDLKNGKKRYSNMMLRGAGKIKHSIRMSDLKVTTTKNGRKKATFKMTWKIENKLSNAQARKVLRILSLYDYEWDAMEAWDHMFFVDYVTGRNLEDSAYSNGFKLVKKKLTRRDCTKKYVSSDGSWFYLVKHWTVAVTVTFPADYKNLCVGVGFGKSYGYNTFSKDWSYIDDYESGVSFYQTSWCKKCKDNLHFARIK